jgi:hypothetical protein
MILVSPHGSPEGMYTVLSVWMIKVSVNAPELVAAYMTK